MMLLKVMFCLRKLNLTSCYESIKNDKTDILYMKITN